MNSTAVLSYRNWNPVDTRTDKLLFYIIRNDYFNQRHCTNSPSRYLRKIIFMFVQTIYIDSTTLEAQLWKYYFPIF